MGVVAVRKLLQAARYASLPFIKGFIPQNLCFRVGSPFYCNALAEGKAATDYSILRGQIACNSRFLSSQ
ncbi:hypothetical protein D3C76_213440 [compost metagenome]